MGSSDKRNGTVQHDFADPARTADEAEARSQKAACLVALMKSAFEAFSYGGVHDCDVQGEYFNCCDNDHFATRQKLVSDIASGKNVSIIMDKANSDELKLLFEHVGGVEILARNNQPPIMTIKVADQNEEAKTAFASTVARLACEKMLGTPTTQASKIPIPKEKIDNLLLMIDMGGAKMHSELLDRWKKRLYSANGIAESPHVG